MSDIKEANCITFDYKGNHYCLEYTRESVKRMEVAGFKPVESGSTPLIELDMLWAGAFYKNHRKTSSRVIEEILDAMNDKEKLLDTLRRMVSETYNSLIEDKGDEGNGISWTATL